MSRSLMRARLAEQAERYDDMFAAMTEVAREGALRTSEEQQLFGAAVGNVTRALRASLRTTLSAMQGPLPPTASPLLYEVRAVVEDPLLQSRHPGSRRLALNGDHFVVSSRNSRRSCGASSRRSATARVRQRAFSVASQSCISCRTKPNSPPTAAAKQPWLPFRHGCTRRSVPGFGDD